MKTYIIILGFVFAAALMNPDMARGQQDPLYTQYMFNTLAFNPAYAGSRNALCASLHARTQWTGIKDAPQTQTLLFHSTLKNSNMGTGLSVVNDVAGPLTQRNIMGYYSYSVRFSQQDRLSFGVSAGVYTLSADLPGVELADDENDAAFRDVYEDAAKINVGFGMFYHSNSWYVGLSTPKLYTSPFLSDKIRREMDVKQHYYLVGGAMVDLSHELKLKPTLLIRKVGGSPMGLECSALFVYREKFWGGLAARWEDAASVIVGGQIMENFKIGYSYDITFSTLSKVSSGSHEIFISYELPLVKDAVPMFE